MMAGGAMAGTFNFCHSSPISWWSCWRSCCPRFGFPCDVAVCDFLSSECLIFRSFAAVIGFAFTNPEKVTFRQNLFLGTAGLLGMGIGPLIAASAPGFVFDIFGLFKGWSSRQDWGLQQSLVDSH